MTRFLLLGTMAFSIGQGPLAYAQSSPKPSPAPAPLVIRISVDLIQIDAVVTDKRGEYVKDLGPADFEIEEDGRRQAISHVAYVKAGAASVPATPIAQSSEGGAPLDSAGLPRTLLFVVDDLGLSSESATQMREAFSRFAHGHMEEGDRAAIVRTGDLKYRQAFRYEMTADRSAILAAIPTIRFTPRSRRSQTLPQLNAGPSTPLTAYGGPLLARTDMALAGADHAYEALSATDSIAAVRALVDSLRRQPGRKALVLMSEGFYVQADPTDDDRRLGGIRQPLDHLFGVGDRVEDALRSLTELANRASVVIHTIDPRGVATTGVSAGSLVSNASPETLPGLLRSRAVALRESQGTLRRLAEQTGGLSFESNDLDDGLRHIHADQDGYYLIGYEPGTSTFSRSSEQRAAFHRIKVKVKRPDLKVRSRAGFYGVTDEEIATVAPPPPVP